MAIPRPSGCKGTGRGPANRAGAPLRLTLAGSILPAAHVDHQLGIASLHAYVLTRPDLRDRVEVRRIDFDFRRMQVDEAGALADRIVRTRPDVVGLSCFAWDLDVQIAAARCVGALLPGVRIVAGGPSATALHTALTAPGNPVDVVVRGEGEGPLADLLRRDDWRDLAGIAGITWRAPDGSVREEPDREPLDYATLPSPYLSGAVAPEALKSALFSRGCVLSCKHCAWRIGGGFRPAAPDRIRAEIALMRDSAEKDPYGFWIHDSSLNTTDEHLELISSAIAEADPDGRMPLEYYVGVRCFKPGHVRHLARIRTRRAHFGFESLNPAALATLGRPPLDAERFASVLGQVSDAVPCSAYLMLGIPGDDLAGFKRSVDFLVRLADRKPGRILQDAIVFWTIVPPGTRFAEASRRLGVKTLSPGMPFVCDSKHFPTRDLVAAAEHVLNHPDSDLFRRFVMSDMSDVLARIDEGHPYANPGFWESRLPEVDTPPPPTAVRTRAASWKDLLDRAAEDPQAPLGDLRCAAPPTPAGEACDDVMTVALEGPQGRLDVAIERGCDETGLPTIGSFTAGRGALPEGGPGAEPGLVAARRTCEFVLSLVDREERLRHVVESAELDPGDWPRVRAEVHAPRLARRATVPLPWRGFDTDDPDVLRASHALDLAGVESGIKPVASLEGLGPASQVAKRRDELEAALPGMAVAVRTPRGADRDRPVLYVGADRALVEEAAALSARLEALPDHHADLPAIHSRLGVLHGYPDCCVAAFAADAAGLGGRPEWLRLGRFASGEPCAPPPFSHFLALHVPCAPRCRATSELISRILADPASCAGLDRFARAHSEADGTTWRDWGGLPVIRFLNRPGEFVVFRAVEDLDGTQRYRLAASFTSHPALFPLRQGTALVAGRGSIRVLDGLRSYLEGPRSLAVIHRAAVYDERGLRQPEGWSAYLKELAAAPRWLPSSVPVSEREPVPVPRPVSEPVPAPKPVNEPVPVPEPVHEPEPAAPGGVAAARRILARLEAHPRNPLHGFAAESIRAVATSNGPSIEVSARRDAERIIVSVRPRGEATAYLLTPRLAVSYAPETPLDSPDKLRALVAIAFALDRHFAELFG